MRSEIIKTIATECGFDLVGVTPAIPASEADFYHDWVASGYAGEMAYLTDRRAQVRNDPRNLLASARSIICVGKLYGDTSTAAPPDSARISRYAQGADYHDTLRQMLEEMVEKMLAVAGPFEWRICVDTAPLLERAYAQHAGLGWIGKNTCLINQQLGSWFFLAELLVSLDIEPDAPPPDRCGTCSRCIDACPTAAIVPTETAAGPAFTIDSRRCISYLTIERRGVVPEGYRAAIGNNVFGCDICQEVCPWNEERPFSNNAPLLEDLAALSPDEFRERFRHTAVWRTKYSGFLRNVALAMGNSKTAKFQEPLAKLVTSPDPIVAETAGWALNQLR